MDYLNKDSTITSGVYADYFSQNLIDTLNQTEELDTWVNGVTLNHDGWVNGNSMSQKLEMVARLMLLNEERSVNRDFFYLTMGGFDAHSLAKSNLQGNLDTVNQGITNFYEEMKTHDGMLNSFTFVVMSEFSRTITENSGKGDDVSSSCAYHMCIYVCDLFLIHI